MSITTVGKLLRQGAEVLGTHSRIEVEMLLGYVLNFDRAKLLAYNTDEVSEEKEQQFQQLIEARRQGEPLQYLIGKTNFMGLEYKVTPAVLIPRFDTEILVEEALNLAKNMGDSLQVLDLCTGSGTIAVSLAKFLPQAKVYASDLSVDALEVAKENAKGNEVDVDYRQGDLLAPFGEEFYQYFDLIASNPPYITTAEFEELPIDVKKEPTMALVGGEDGLIFYRRLAQECGAYLKADGVLIMEVGHTQGPAVKALMEENQFREVRILKDWQQLDRVVVGMK